MPTARDFLDRFRPVGTPGAAAPAGVPVDRRAAMIDELAPVLALLAPTADECDRLRAAAAGEAARVREDAAARSAALLARAREQAEAARVEAAARARQRLDAEAAALHAQAEAEAAMVTALAASRLPELRDLVLARVRERLLGGPAEPVHDPSSDTGPSARRPA